MQNNTTPYDVGRSFVHQYYTLLHQAPEMLHRFYSTDSTFIHGGLDRTCSSEQPAVGPQNIANRINELNIRDCHAKIRQVDSHPTIGDGVVIQVTGELSNNGQPMRRFMQTFVLAPREPKKYYVQNDIFRYQDEVFEEGSDEDDQSSSQDKASNADSSVMIAQQSVPVTNTVRPNTEEEEPLPPRRTTQPTNVPAATVAQPTSTEVDARPQESNGFNPSTNQQETQESVKVVTREVQPSKSTPSEGISSYAGVTKMSTPSNTVNSTVTVPANPTPVPVATTNVRATTNKRTSNSQRNLSDSNRPNNRPPAHFEGPSNDSRNSGNSSSPNDHQVFVGSLPASFTQQDLIDCFSQFGKVVYAKISNSNQDFKKKYGFVAFDNAETASSVVSKQHIMYKDNRLNVEPKIPKNSSGNPSGVGNQRNSYPQRGGRSGNGNYGRPFRNGSMNTRREASSYQEDSAGSNAPEESNKVST